MRRLAHSATLGILLAFTAGCSTPDSFTFTADLPADFAYVAAAYYLPAVGQTCTVPIADNLAPQFNRHWRKDYRPDSKIELRRTRNGCELVLSRIELTINASYGDTWSDVGSEPAYIAVRNQSVDTYKGTFNAAGESEFFGECQWLFRTLGALRRIVKILNCSNTDEHGNVFNGRPFVGFTRDDLPGKTVRLKIKLADEERPYMKDTWVKVPGGWKRCMGENFEDQYAFCYGNYRDFSTFRMPGGRQCTIYPGCTETKEKP